MTAKLLASGQPFGKNGESTVHEGDQLMTGEAVAAWLGITDRQLRRLRAERKLAYYRVGAHLLYRRSDVDTLLTESRVPARTEAGR